MKGLKLQSLKNVSSLFSFCGLLVSCNILSINRAYLNQDCSDFDFVILRRDFVRWNFVFCRKLVICFVKNFVFHECVCTICFFPFIVSYKLFIILVKALVHSYSFCLNFPSRLFVIFFPLRTWKMSLIRDNWIRWTRFVN